MPLPAGTYNIINKTTGKYVNLAQSRATVPLAPIVAWESSGTGGENEKWVVAPTGAYYTIRSKLDVNAFAGAECTYTGSPVISGPQAEQWDLVSVTGGGYKIKFWGQDLVWTYLNSTDADGIRIRYKLAGTVNEVWNFVPVT